MPYNLEYNQEHKCIMSNIEGKIDKKLLEELSNKIEKLIEKYNCKKISNDLRSARLNLSIFEIYHIPKMIHESKYIPLCRRALVISKNPDDYKFFKLFLLTLDKK